MELRKLYSFSESYWIFYNGIRTMRYMYKVKRNKEISPQFIERIMLAVTEVNNCQLCSNAHTKKAILYGMNINEIKKILAGFMEDIPADEIAAIKFAQHYAETRGNPSKEAWEDIIEIYGISKARGILGSVRTIMIGNAYGIPWSSFFNRLKGRPDPRSSLRYELSMILGTFLVPISLTHAILSDLLKIPVINL